VRESGSCGSYDAEDVYVIDAVPEFEAIMFHSSLGADASAIDDDVHTVQFRSHVRHRRVD
jgi:hypothetical protein